MERFEYHSDVIAADEDWTDYLNACAANGWEFMQAVPADRFNSKLRVFLRRIYVASLDTRH